MLNFPMGQLMHRHADGGSAPMTEHHVDDHDPERAMVKGELRGARIFRCTSCDEEIIVQPPTKDNDDASA